MEQSINLLDALPQKHHVILPVSLMLKILMFFFLALMVLFFSIYYRVSSLHQSLQTLQKQESVTATSIISLTKALSEMAAGAQLNKKTKSLRQEIAGKKEVLVKLKTINFKTTDGFASLFSGMEKAGGHRAWIDSVNIKAATGTSLEGEATSSKDAASFINHLNQLSNFKEYPFKLQTLKRSGSKKGGSIQFRLTSSYGARAVK